MNEPDRLIDHCDDEFVRALLAEGRRPVESKQRTLAVLAALGAGGAVFSKAGWAAAATWKNAAVALLVVGSGAATYQWVVPALRANVHSGPGVTAAVPNSNLQRSEPIERAVVEGPTEVQLPKLQPEPERTPAETVANGSRAQRVGAPDVAAASRNSARKVRDPAAATTGSALSIEVSLLDKARAALRSGRPDQALLVLEKYSAEHPNGALQREAELVRIPALYQSGRRGEASARAKRVLAKNPNSLVAEQMKVYVSP